MSRTRKPGRDETQSGGRQGYPERGCIYDFVIARISRLYLAYLVDWPAGIEQYATRSIGHTTIVEGSRGPPGTHGSETDDVAVRIAVHRYGVPQTDVFVGGSSQ